MDKSLEKLRNVERMQWREEQEGGRASAIRRYEQEGNREANNGNLSMLSAVQEHGKENRSKSRGARRRIFE